MIFLQEANKVPRLSRGPDLFLASFDATEAIFNPDFVFPDPDAPVFDNVEILVKKFEAKPLPPSTSAEKGTDMATSAIFFNLFVKKWMVCPANANR